MMIHPISPHKLNKTLTFISFNALRILTIGVGFYSMLFMLTEQIGTPHFHEKIDRSPIVWGLHLWGGGVALMACSFLVFGPGQSTTLSLHRWLGRTYVIAVILAAIAGFRLAFETLAGLPSNLGLATLSICWLIATLNGLRFGILKQPESHRVWMLRSFALTISAVFFRLDLALLAVFTQAQFVEIYATVSWHSWVCTLIVVEWFFIRRTSKKVKADVLLINPQFEH